MEGGFNRDVPSVWLYKCNLDWYIILVCSLVSCMLVVFAGRDCYENAAYCCTLRDRVASIERF